ncbi:TetR/AcrR family transcriptional regulator [Nonomuraea sp. NBC_01738]|uniref:TetR family transcriptional regulator n=1 Tax=Nonomuraea sp. NBC_01738 TaxID=2976003 RepID=UPI002E11F036|nr:TetR/AcrR family transcriptional regulator [Nonomuraea sp. NBC_01738]
MAGVSKEKKALRREHIRNTALALFAERGFEAVTVNEIAEAAGVAKVTLFNYFPSKEDLVLDGVKEDTAAVVAARRPGQTPLDALREHYLAMPDGVAGLDVEALMTRMRIIVGSAALVAGVQRIQYLQRVELAAVLSGRAACDAHTDDLEADLMAAQIVATVQMVQQGFFQRLAAGVSLREAGTSLAGDVRQAFDLLEHGYGRRYAQGD